MEEIKKIEVQGQQYGVADMLMRSVMGGNAQVIAWSHTHNMNDYKDAGTYRIKGERTGNPLDDNLPIMNQGSGHTIDGILYVLDSSLTNGSGNSDDFTVTQFLMLSNRVGGQEGDMYMRSAYGVSKDNLTWKPWEKYQTNMEVGCVSDYYSINTLTTSGLTVLDPNGGMTTFIDNGIYSGVYIPPKAILGTPEDIGDTVQPNPSGIETFVMVVINNYAFAGDDKKTITQIKFAVTLGGVFSMEKRCYHIVDGGWEWSQWESVGGGSGSSNSLINEPNTSSSSSLVLSSDALNLKLSTYSGDWDIIAQSKSLVFSSNKENVICSINAQGITLGSDSQGSGGIYLHDNVRIGSGVFIDGGTMGITIEDLGIKTHGEYYRIKFPIFGPKDNYCDFRPNSIKCQYYSPDTNNWFNMEIGPADPDRNVGGRLLFSDDEGGQKKLYISQFTDECISLINRDVLTQEDVTTTLPYGLTIEPSEDGNKLLFSYNGKTAELPLT